MWIIVMPSGNHGVSDTLYGNPGWLWRVVVTSSIPTSPELVYFYAYKLYSNNLSCADVVFEYNL